MSLPRPAQLAVGVVLVLMAALGCRREAQSPPPASSTPARGANEARLDAALQIGSSDLRDQALSQVALAAAQEAEPAVARRAVAAIGNSEVFDQTARKAALLLTGMKTSDAVELAKTIRSTSVRDQTLSEIAGVKSQD